jgi:RimJ/RimL family protein N-acetyltransferase
MSWPAPVRLAGTHTTLEPLAREHEAGLVEAVRDGELWKLWYTAIPAPEGMAAEIERRLALQAAGAMLPFTVRDAEGRIAGMTTYMHIDAANRRVEIGSTWYARRVQRTALNTECSDAAAPCVRGARLHAVEFRPTSSTSKAGAASNAWARNSTASCAATSAARTAACATPASTASSPPNGRR